MQYEIRTNKGTDAKGEVLYWSVSGFDDKGEFLGTVGNRFRTAEGAQAFIDRQAGITITFVRDAPHFKRDFKVLINGEHRATFRSRKRYWQTGYDLEACDGGRIYLRHYTIDYVQANFEVIVRRTLHEGSIPTMADIARYQLITQAERENREHDTQIAQRHAQVRQEVLVGALGLYLNAMPDDEHRAKAEQILREVARA